MSEHTIQNQCIECAKARGAVVIRVNSGGSISKRGGHIRLAEKGTSDTIMLYKGFFLAVEFKDVGEKPSEKQLEFGRKVTEAGGLFWVIDSVDKLMTEMDTIDRRY